MCVKEIFNFPIKNDFNIINVFNAGHMVCGMLTMFLICLPSKKQNIMNKLIIKYNIYKLCRLLFFFFLPDLMESYI